MLQLLHPRPLGLELGVGHLGRGQDVVDEAVPVEFCPQPVQPLPGEAGVRIGGEPEAEPELGVVLEERVRPGRAAAGAVLRPRRRRQVAAVDRRAAGRVCHHQALAEELGEELHVGRLAAAGAGAGELEERLEELGAANARVVDAGAVVHRQRLEERDPLALAGHDRLARLQVDGLPRRRRRVLHRAGLDAQCAAGAVLDVDLEREAGVGQAARLEHRREEPGGRGLEPLRLVEPRPDHAVRAHEATAPALDARVGIPHRHEVGDVPLLVGGRAARVRAVDRKRAHRELVAAAGQHRPGHLADELGRPVRDGRAHVVLGGQAARQLDPMEGRERAVHGGVVSLDHLGSAAGVGVLDRVLDPGDGIVAGKDAREREEARLKDGVRAAGEPRFPGDAAGVDRVHLDALREHLLLDRERQGVPHRIRWLRAVEEQGRAGGGAAEDVDRPEEAELMAADEPGTGHEVGRLDRLVAEAQVRDRLRARLLRVVDEVALGREAGVTEDLDRVLVGADGAVGAETEEHRPHRPGRLDVELGADGDARPADVVADADGEPPPRPLAAQLLQDARHHRRGELLRGEPVAAAGHERQVARPARMRLAERRDDVEEERLALRARLLGAVEHGDPAHRRRKRSQELRRREGPHEPQLDDADPLAAGDQSLDGAPRRDGARAGQDEDALGLWVAVVGDQAVAPPDPARQGVHRLLDDRRRVRVERVHGLARLEVGVRVLGGATDERPVGRERPAAMGVDELLGDERAQVVVGERLDRVQLVRRPKAVEEVDERDPRAQRRRLGDERQVVGLLDGVGGQKREPGAAGGHHVGVVAEDREPLGRERPGGDVEDRRRELPRDLEHVGEHEEQALRCREGRRKRARLERAVKRAGRAALALHLDDGRHRPPHVRPPFARPLVGQLGHRRGGRDRVDAADLVQAVCDRGRSLVAVHDHPHSTSLTMSIACTGHWSKQARQPVQRS